MSFSCTYIMRLILFEEKAEIQDQYPLSLNRDQDRLQKYWAISLIWRQIIYVRDQKILNSEIRKSRSPEKAGKLVKQTYFEYIIEKMRKCKNFLKSEKNPEKIVTLMTFPSIIVSTAKQCKSGLTPLSLIKWSATIWNRDFVNYSVKYWIEIRFVGKNAKLITTWWGSNLIEKKSFRIAESGFGKLRVCSFIV